MHLTMVEGCSLDIMMEVGTPKGVDFAAAGRYDDDVISKQERANDDRNIMYDAGIGEQGRRNAKQRSYLFDCGSGGTKCRRRAFLQLRYRIFMFALRRVIEKIEYVVHKKPKMLFRLFMVESEKEWQQTS